MFVFPLPNLWSKPTHGQNQLSDSKRLIGPARVAEAAGGWNERVWTEPRHQRVTLTPGSDVQILLRLQVSPAGSIKSGCANFRNKSDTSAASATRRTYLKSQWKLDVTCWCGVCVTLWCRWSVHSTLPHAPATRHLMQMAWQLTRTAPEPRHFRAAHCAALHLSIYFTKKNIAGDHRPASDTTPQRESLWRAEFNF